MNKTTVVAAAIAIYVSYVVREFWTMLPESASSDLMHPFPFSDQEIYKSTYVWIACVYIMFALTAFVFYRITHHWFFEVAFYIQFAELVEYFFCYNNPWYEFNIWDILCHVNITKIRLIILGICIILVVLKRSEQEIGPPGQRRQ